VRIKPSRVKLVVAPRSANVEPKQAAPEERAAD
jgi:hypothetical protein